MLSSLIDASVGKNDAQPRLFKVAFTESKSGFYGVKKWLFCPAPMASEFPTTNHNACFYWQIVKMWHVPHIKRHRTNCIFQKIFFFKKSFPQKCGPQLKTKGHNSALNFKLKLY